MNYSDFLPELRILWPLNEYPLLSDEILIESFKCFCRDHMQLKIWSKKSIINEMFKPIEKSPRSWRRTWGKLRIKHITRFGIYLPDLVKHFIKHREAFKSTKEQPLK